MNVGWERKIGYSFMGLLVGDLVNLVVLLLVALLPQLDSFFAVKKVGLPASAMHWLWLCELAFLNGRVGSSRLAGGGFASKRNRDRSFSNHGGASWRGIGDFGNASVPSGA